MGGMLSGITGTEKAPTLAAKATSAGDYAAIAEQKRQFAETQKSMQPWLTAGKTALGLESKYAGLGGKEAQNKAFADFMASPEQSYFKQAGTDALNRNATAIGGVGSQRVLDALGKQGAGWASQDYENQYNRLFGLSNTGQKTAGQIGELGATAAGAIGRLGIDAGTAKSNATMANYQQNQAAKQQIIGGIGSAMGA